MKKTKKIKRGFRSDSGALSEQSGVGPQALVTLLHWHNPLYEQLGNDVSSNVRWQQVLQDALRAW